MRHEPRYTPKSLKNLEQIPPQIADRIIRKILFYSRHENPIIYAEKLSNCTFGDYRFRIGDYRVIFDIDKHDNIVILLILAVKHRKDIYK